MALTAQIISECYSTLPLRYIPIYSIVNATVPAS